MIRQIVRGCGTLPHVGEHPGTIIVERKAYTSAATHYTLKRNEATYYVSDSYGHEFGVQQRYIKRNGTPSQRRVPKGKLRDELVAAIETIKLEN